MPSPFLFFAGARLSEAELTAACLDGHVVELGEAYLPADAVETPALRARSLEALLGDTLAATHLSAAWIHGALPEPPGRHTVQRAVDRRLHHVVGRRFVYRDLRVDERDLMVVGGVRVTTPERTLADLARMPDDEHRAAAELLAATAPALIERTLAWLDERGPLPHRGAAMRLLKAIQEDVTR
ncbi:type IV toxin-antitoxin system AbiEi family antitoxin [Microbacterium fluvii]|uniref:Type IV toxin-antitoxin system AbiEi family antitoxin n=1 Tax=Microbacterium fluvii TaxID=415215 RepID=A0ABW2HBZ5_9MICO|nr:type IV toxin-antitoxin system AbiEi family antitoxin [Microbacterium fluvii]MCU4672007.1 type IV toxin-antitoxin system AbiEi family antitoxin [Microbacterium fluvii]